MNELDENEGGPMEAFPRELPMANDDYTLPDYYVRKCYAEYYALVLKMLETYDIVSVVGTSGIGTSIFYAYFYQHYKRKPNTTIIAASCTDCSNIIKVVVFRGDGKQTERSGAEEGYRFIRKTREAARNRGDDLLYLYDGPPQFPPERPSKTICFTSPNEQWTRMTTKLRTACELYMPLWTLDELFDAAYHLGLSADVAQKIKERFAIFGGVPRGLFTANERFVSGLAKQLAGDIFC